MSLLYKIIKNNTYLFTAIICDVIITAECEQMECGLLNMKDLFLGI